MSTAQSEPAVDLRQFKDWVHSALRQFYDALSLDSHPLTHIICGPEKGAIDHAQTLRSALLGAIDSLQPTHAVSAQSADWRGYRILEMRFIEGLSPDEVMGRLALGKSQFFRDQARSVHRLSGLLWSQHAQALTAASPRGGTATGDLLSAETDRMLSQTTVNVCDLAHVQEELRIVVSPLAVARGTSLHLQPGREACTVRASRVVLRQAVVNALTYGLEACSGGHLVVRIARREGEAHIEVRLQSAQLNSPSETSDAHGQSTLDVCRQLLGATGGHLRVTERTGKLRMLVLSWPASDSSTLLVIDDNRGFLDLFRRYLAGHPWRVVGAQNGAAARRAIAEDTLCR